MSGTRPETSISPPGSTPEEVEYELRAALSAYWSGGRLLIGMFAFFFASLAFAYFYLRSNNSADLWRPHGITAPTALGATVVAVALAASALVVFGQWRLRRGEALDWQVATWMAVLALLLAAGLQIYELTQLPFFPGSSGYASCFVAWAVMNLVLLFSAAYWAETLGARALRLRALLGEGETIADSPLTSAQVLRANIDAASYFFGFVAIVSGLFWLFFYVV